MLASALLALREGLEAALIVGILLGYLRQVGRLDCQRNVWAGVMAAVVGSLGVAVALQVAGAEFEGRAEQLFEGCTMLLAVAVLTWMIFWMRYQARFFRTSLEQEVRTALQAGQSWGLAALSFVAVFREGVETALLLSAAAFANQSGDTLIGALIGLTVAVLLGWAVYSGSRRLNLRRFFDATSVLLLMFAAGLLARAVHEFQEAALLPLVVEQVWNTQRLLSDQSTFGAVLRSLFGYNDAPSLLEVLSYAGYWIVVVITVWRWTARIVRRTLPESRPIGSGG
jgi:high-affinity iron transporter